MFFFSTLQLEIFHRLSTGAAISFLFLLSPHFNSNGIPDINIHNDVAGCITKIKFKVKSIYNFLNVFGEFSRFAVVNLCFRCLQNWNTFFSFLHRQRSESNSNRLVERRNISLWRGAEIVMHPKLNCNYKVHVQWICSDKRLRFEGTTKIITSKR